MQAGGIRTPFLGEEPLSILPWSCSPVSALCCVVDSQSALLSSLPSTPPQPWACQRSALVPLRLCAHKASRTIELRLQGCSSWVPRTHCGSYGDSSDSGPAQLLHACTHKAHSCTPPSLGSTCRLFGCSACAELTKLVEEV